MRGRTAPHAFPEGTLTVLTPAVAARDRSMLPSNYGMLQASAPDSGSSEGDELSNDLSAMEPVESEVDVI